MFVLIAGKFCTCNLHIVYIQLLWKTKKFDRALKINLVNIGCIYSYHVFNNCSLRIAVIVGKSNLIFSGYCVYNRPLRI